MAQGVRLAFVGKPNSGQIQAAVYLKRKHHFKRVRMIIGPTRFLKFLYNYKRYERPPWDKRREVYNLFYKIDPDVWINYIVRRMERTTEPVVIDDVRYVNEVQKLKEAGFTIVRFSTFEKNRAKSIGRYLGKDIVPGTVTLTEYFNKDATEILRVDYSIFFDGSHANLHKAVDDLLKNLTTD